MDGGLLSFDVDTVPELERYREHTIELVIAELGCETGEHEHWKEAIENNGGSDPLGFIPAKRLWGRL